eukprot:gene16729-34798_t
MKLKRQQQGLTFMGLIIVGILLALAGVVFAQVVPTYIEYIAVQKAVDKAAAGSTVAEVRSIFDKAATIDDIRTISAKDLVVGKEGDRVVAARSDMQPGQGALDGAPAFLNPELLALQRRLQHTFANPRLLERALTHRSFTADHLSPEHCG